MTGQGGNNGGVESGPLLTRIRNEIAHNGPLTIARYMDLCLGDPQFGYYRTRDPIGARGDFVTAPEISQMFGELIGLWCAHIWTTMGSPALVRLVELGPGRGTLMADLLRAAAAAPGFMDAADIHLVETSPVLRQCQADVLAPFGVRPTWHDRLEDVPPGPTVLVANEFFDALPIRQIERTSRGWHERLVGLGDNASDSGLAFGLSPDPLTGELPEAADMNSEQGTIVEYCAPAARISGLIAARLVRDDGAALIIDYGYRGPAAGDTFQALGRHRYVSVFEQPGTVDLTAHVDFSGLARPACALGAKAYGPMEQGRFLNFLGLDLRAQKLKSTATVKQANQIDSAVERLTAPQQMGQLFKVLAMTAPELPTPPPFGDPET